MANSTSSYDHMLKHYEATAMFRFIGEPKLLHQWFWYDSRRESGYWEVVPSGDDAPPEVE